MKTLLRQAKALIAVFGMVVTSGIAYAVDAESLIDQPYAGTLTLSVDLTDVTRKIFRAHEVIPVKPGAMTLYYPKWIPGEHAPSGPIVNLTGLKITANGQPVKWRRDLVDMYAMHVDVPEGAHQLDLEFQFLSPSSGGLYGQSVSVTPKLIDLEWNQVALYPAGYYSRQITIQPSVKLPQNWQFSTALEVTSQSGSEVQFKPVSFENLVDSPLMAGEHFKRIDLAPGDKVPVHLNLAADRAADLAITEGQIGQFRRLVQQGIKLFGSHHYDHYDFLLSLSDGTGHFGLEHHQSSDNRLGADYFTDKDAYLIDSGLLPHEYVHSWNGKFRRPANLWTPDFNTPMQDDLLWVYEGLTTYYGDVLTARSSLWTPEQYREQLARVAAVMDHQVGRTWRPLQDTADAAQLLHFAPYTWDSWRRSADYYPESELIWLEADTKIRELSKGKRSLDDFARAFYGINNGSYVPVMYTFDDVVKALNSVQAFDWTDFLRTRLDTTEPRAPLAGLAQGGWKLVYSETPSALFKAREKYRHAVDVKYSIGLVISTKESENGKIFDVLWQSPAFKAGLAPGARIIAVNGHKFNKEELKEAIKNSKTGTQPIELLVENSEYFSTVRIDYHEGAKYPILVRDGKTPDRLSEILKPRH